MAKKYQIHGDFGSGSCKNPYVAQDTPPEDKTVLWIDTDDDSASEFNTQSDWNQNDPTASDYVKNRPFSMEKAELVIEEEQTLNFVDVLQPCPLMTPPVWGDKYTIEDQEVLLNGYPFRVVWDGVVYDCVSNNGAIGNLYLFDPQELDTHEPFVILGGSIVFTSELGEHTLSLSLIDETVYPIDEKYLPNSVPVISNVATPGQIIKISAVDKNGVPTAWESVGFLSSELLVADGTKIASGVIPNGTKAYTNNETGVTLGDLKKWKKFRIVSNLGTNSYFDVGCYASSRNQFISFYDPIHGSMPTTSVCDFEWMDTDRTILDIHHTTYALYNSVPDTIITTVDVGGSGFDNYLASNIYEIQSNMLIFRAGYDSLKIMYKVLHDQLADGTWCIYGILKYGEV